MRAEEARSSNALEKFKDNLKKNVEPAKNSFYENFSFIGTILRNSSKKSTQETGKYICSPSKSCFHAWQFLRTIAILNLGMDAVFAADR